MYDVRIEGGLEEGSIYTSTFEDKQYRAPGKSMYFLLSRTQAGPGRTVKQVQEQFLATTYKLFPGALYTQMRYRGSSSKVSKPTAPTHSLRNVPSNH